MVLETKRLVTEWDHWTRVAAMKGTAVQDVGADEIRFCSRDGDYNVKRDGSWWVVDESDERGKSYPATVTCSTIQLVEKYLIWTWASTARTAVGAEQLSRRFQRQGFDAEVRHLASVRANFTELTTPDGIAVVPNSRSVILGHVLALSLAQLDEMLRAGL